MLVIMGLVRLDMMRMLHNLLKIHMGIEILEVKVGIEIMVPREPMIEMSGAALVIEMLDTLVVMGMAMLDIT